MAKSTLYNFNKTTPTVITDEGYTDCGATAFVLGDTARAFTAENMVVRTASGGGGDLLIADVDYELTEEDFYYTEEVGYHIYKSVTIINADYQTGTLYFSYDCYGTYTSIATIQALLNAMATALPKASPVRQTVLEGAVDTAGDPNYLSIGAGLTVDMAASVTPVRMSFAHGFGDNGAVDYIEKYITDQVFSALTPFANPFLFAERTGAGILSLSHSVYTPQYSKAFLGAEAGAILAHFEGAGTSFMDSYNNVSAFGANASLSGTQKKFGASSVRHNNATNGYIECDPIKFNTGKWTIEWWAYFDGVAANQIMLSCSETYCLQVSMLTATKKLYLYLGNGATWSIANAQIGSTVLSAATWYRVILQFDGANYKLWLDDGATVNPEATVASTASIAQPSKLRIGGAATSIIGYSDELRVSPYARYTTPVVQSAAWTEEEMYWLSLSQMISYKGYPGSWTACDRVYQGECVTDGVAVLSVIAYALLARYESAVFSAVEGTLYSLSHNIGTSRITLRVLARQGQGYNWTMVDTSVMVSTAAASQRAHGSVAWDRIALKFLTASVDLLEIDSVDDDVIGAAAVENIAQVLIHAERIF